MEKSGYTTLEDDPPPYQQQPTTNIPPSDGSPVELSDVTATLPGTTPGQPRVKAGQQTTVVITNPNQQALQQANQGLAAKLRLHPVQITCSACHVSITTRVEYVTCTAAYLTAVGIFLHGGVFGCCLLPFFVNGFKDTIHFCPACSVCLGRKNRF